ncbi:MAG TPA: hypothetical protein VIU86_01450 [Gaiellaceae bacterium]
MDPEPLLSRGEIEGILFVIADIGAGVKRIVALLEEELGGEDQEDDA